MAPKLPHAPSKRNSCAWIRAQLIPQAICHVLAYIMHINSALILTWNIKEIIKLEHTHWACIYIPLSVTSPFFIILPKASASKVCTMTTNGMLGIKWVGEVVTTKGQPLIRKNKILRIHTFFTRKCKPCLDCLFIDLLWSFSSDFRGSTEEEKPDY